MLKLTGWKREVLDWVFTLGFAVIVALLLRNYVFALVKVQGTSMEPTLSNSDKLYINKLMYKPKRGDIIVFVPESDPKRPYIKRVIAVEGDTVYIDFETSKVYVNNEVIDEPYINEPTKLTGSYISRLVLSGHYSKDEPIVVEEGKVFAMGDNRNVSKDSREIGQVPVEDIEGGVCFRFWPFSEFGAIPDNDNN